MNAFDTRSGVPIPAHAGGSVPQNGFGGRLDDAVRAAAPVVSGRVRRVVGLHVDVAGIDASIGDEVLIDAPDGTMPAEVIAIQDGAVVCLPHGHLDRVAAGTPVRATGTRPSVLVGPALLGRVLDGFGRPLDGRPLDGQLQRVGIDGTPPHPLRRQPVDRHLPLGVRALDTLVPCGRGQRLGIFAGSGVGKSSLLSMIARGTAADVTVLALIGERGREVREFLDRDLGPEGLDRSVVVVATSDQPALVRLRAASTATRIAEDFRDRGLDVVLMMDSLTRFAMAQREVGLTAGEPPATRGYPPSVFTLLPRLLERAGGGETGTITGLYTVLVEGDDLQDPIGDAARSILDGHVVLSRKLATAGHFPTIDVLESISRVTGAITTPAQQALATEVRGLLAALRDARDLIDIGAYAPGANPQVDRAIRLEPAITAFLRQGMQDQTPSDEAWAQLELVLRSDQALVPA
ncbi:MAG TPA: FliI/YscN family ATPase [Acidimicrobiales bacterium]|nr:FliI/YscN family ATPase [Acidimicrobiales bacterium]